MTYQHSPASRAVLRALVPVICPPQALPLADAIIDHMALTIGASPAVLRTLIGVGLAAYDLGALPRHGRRARDLTGDAAEAYFQSWDHGVTPFHVQFAHALNQLMSLSCYEQPAMMESVGYRPAGWIEEVSRKRLAVYAGDIQRQAVSILAPDPLRPGVRLGQRKERA